MEASDGLTAALSRIAKEPPITVNMDLHTFLMFNLISKTYYLLTGITYISNVFLCLMSFYVQKYLIVTDIQRNSFLVMITLGSMGGINKVIVCMT